MAQIAGFFVSIADKAYHYGLPFVVVLSILVFVHEFGHFWVARRCGVKVETFSIGFGREIFGWTDKLGTRWRIGWAPIGGFVKMYGDADASSRPDYDAIAGMSPEALKGSFFHKKLWQKALVIGAGPGANFLFAITVMTVLFITVGQPYAPPVIGKVMPGSAAEQAGLQVGDIVQTIDGSRIDSFEDLRQTVWLRPGEPLSVSLTRTGQPLTVTVTPQIVEEKDLLGNTQKLGRLGVAPSAEVVMRHVDPVTAVWQATYQTWSIASNSLQAIGQMIVGHRSTDDLSGPIGIGQLSGEVWKEGFVAVANFIALLSVSLGLINLFPIPVLDGGHLLFYAIEAIRGRPVSERALALGFRVGFALIVSFFVFVMWHDLARLMHVASGT